MKVGTWYIDKKLNKILKKISTALYLTQQDLIISIKINMHFLMQYEYIKFKFNWFHPTCSKRLKSNIMWLNFNGFHKELKTLLKIVFPNKPEWINQDHMYWEFLILFFMLTLTMPGILHGKSTKFYLYSYWLHYIDMRTS